MYKVRDCKVGKRWDNWGSPFSLHVYMDREGQDQPAHHSLIRAFHYKNKPIQIC